MVRRKRKEKFIDDGRVISSMNVEGMPWHFSSPPQIGVKRISKPENADAAATGGAYADAHITDARIISPGSVNSSAAGSYSRPEKLTPKENLAFSFGVLKAILLVSAIFLGTLLAFILFCVYVWFR